MESLINVINKYMINHIYGTNNEIIKYINDYAKNHEIINGKGRIVKDVPEITVLDNLKGYSKIKVKNGRGAPNVYFFEPCNEEKVKSLLKNNIIKFGSSNLNLDGLIEKFFEENIIGTRNDIINYIKKESDESPSRTTVYDNLKDVYCFESIESNNSGRPNTYFFRMKDEILAKSLLLNSDKRSIFLLNNVEKKISENIYYEPYRKLLKFGFLKSGLKDFKEYLILIEGNVEMAKELIWNYYLKEKTN
ncbi:MAG: hypothetical protein PHN56_03540 [Candidatus Nanoarchaeia archaeon]|nr:hypothetical protein [Candidatus Nanoarchaeia archaeon]